MQQSGKDAWAVAKTLTDMSGDQWIVKNGKPFNTGKKAPGSKAAANVARAADAKARRAQTDARLKQQAWYKEASLTERNRAALAREFLANARIGISQGNLDLAAQREARLAKGAGAKGGFSKAQIAKWGGQAAAAAKVAYGGVKDKNGDPIPGRMPGLVMKDLIATGMPYSIAWNAIKQYADLAKNSKKTDPISRGWAAAARWNTPSPRPSATGSYVGGKTYMGATR